MSYSRNKKNPKGDNPKEIYPSTPATIPSPGYLKNPLRGSLRGKVALLFIAILLLTQLILFTTSYFFLKNSLKNDEHKEISFLLLNFWAQYQAGGVELLSQEIQINRYTEKAFFVRLADRENNTIMIVVPTAWEDYNFSDLNSLYPTPNNKIRLIHTKDRNKGFTVGSIYLSDGNILQVGISTTTTDTILNHFKKLFFIIALPTLILSIVISLIFSTRLLIPINRLINAATEIIKTGNTKTRIPPSMKRDEVSTLTNLFNTMLKRLDSYIETMRQTLDNVAHDLRTPMTRLKNSAELAIRENNISAYREALNECIENSNSILTMLNTMMDISAAETGVIKLKKTDVNFSEIITDLIELYSYLAENKDIEIDQQIEENLTITVDVNRIRQVFANILDNAVKYTPKGGKITVKAYRATTQSDYRIVIEISDTGIGIPEVEIEHIWDRLYRGKNTGSTRGLGLGLSLVRAIVETHGGKISVESKEGRGTTFRVLL